MLLNLGVDLDGVLYPFHQVTQNYFIEDLGYSSSRIESPEIWDVWEQWDMPENEYWKGIRQGIKDGVIFSKGDPIDPLAAGYLSDLVSKGVSLSIVTARDIPGVIEESRRATFTWLNEHFNIPWSAIVVSSNKAVIQNHFFVDDAIKNLDLVQDNEIIPICFDQPWNSEFPGIRVKSIEDVHGIMMTTLTQISEAYKNEGKEDEA